MAGRTKVWGEKLRIFFYDIRRNTEIRNRQPKQGRKEQYDKQNMAL